MHSLSEKAIFIEHSNFAHSKISKTLYAKWLFLFFSVFAGVAYYLVGYAFAFREGNVYKAFLLCSFLVT